MAVLSVAQDKAAIIWAAATDAGNRSARKAGRQKWGRKDYLAACDEHDRLVQKMMSPEERRLVGWE